LLHKCVALLIAEDICRLLVVAGFVSHWSVKKVAVGGAFLHVDVLEIGTILAEYHTLSVHRSSVEPDHPSRKRRKSANKNNPEKSVLDLGVERISVSVE